jgi:hypothetical protein
MRVFAILLWAFLFSAAPARADLLTPGFRRISHQLVIEPSEAWKGQRIVAFPVRGLSGGTEVAPGVPFGFSSKYSTRLYVLEAGEELPTRADEAWRSGHVSTDLPVTQVAAVPLTSPLESIRTTLKVTVLDDSRLEVEVVDVDEEYDLWMAFGLGAALVLGVSGLIYLRRRRKARSAGAP